MRSLAIGLALACLLLPSAHAQTKKAAEKIGRIAQTQATSACVGGNGSPTCATETLLACFARADKTLCDKVGADPRGMRDAAPIEYVIDRVSVIRQEDITEDMRDLEWFKEQVHAAGGGNYQTLINSALREYVHQKRSRFR